MGHVKFDSVEATLNEGRNRMLLTLVITPLALGLIIVIMAAVKKLKPQPVAKEINAEHGRKPLAVAVQSEAEKENVCCKIFYYFHRP